MATKRDIAFSMNGEPNKNAQHQQEQNEVYNERPAEVGEFIIFKLAKVSRKGGTYIPEICDVPRDEKSKGKERIRLVRGVESIWQKDQKDLDADYIRQNRYSLKFPRGEKIIRINTADTQELEYARRCVYNIDNPYHVKNDEFNFYEYNPKKAAELSLKKEMFELEMAMLANQQPEEKMRKHAHFLGVMATDEYGFPKPIERIKSEYMLAAKRNPEKFQKTLDSEEVEIAFLVRKAVADAKIDINAPDNNINWANGGFIVKYPVRENPIEFLIALALQKSNDGRSFLTQLQSIS